MAEVSYVALFGLCAVLAIFFTGLAVLLRLATRDTDPAERVEILRALAHYVATCLAALGELPGKAVSAVASTLRRGDLGNADTEPPSDPDRELST